MNAALRFEGVVKRYGRRRALDGLSWNVPAGSCSGLIGSNGAGKTTALGIAAGFLRPDAGRVDLTGGGAFDAARHAGRISALPQDAELPRDGNPRDLLRFYGALQGLAVPDARRQTDALLEQVGLADRARSPVRTLSHGMRKRVCLAQCFLGEPELVLLDEPFSGLDPREVHALRVFLRAQRGHRTLVISSHNLHEIERICDRALFLENGRAVREDTIDSLTHRSGVAQYALDGAEPPMEALRDGMPDAVFAFDPESRRLSCRFDPGLRAPGDVHRAVLGILFEKGTVVLEIRLGEQLEREYLKAQEPGRPDG